MKKLKSLPILILAFSSITYAANDWDSVINKNYLDESLGSTITPITNIENGTRWYALVRMKSSFNFEQDNNTDVQSLALRLNGNTRITDDLSFVGNFWMQASEKDGFSTTFDGFDDTTTSWNEFRVGLESKTFGALTYSYYGTTWGQFATDIGSNGLFDAQTEAGGKNAGKLLYKQHFDNNLFLAGSYDHNSKIYGIDVGYQTMDIYGFKPDALGVYFSVHNGQPLVTQGSNNIIGNVDLSVDPENSDSGMGRADENLLTYSLSGYKNYGTSGRLVGHVAYSPIDDNDSIEAMKERLKISKIVTTEGGLGWSYSLGYQQFPTGFKGLSPVLYATYDEFGYSINPEVVWYSEVPGLRANLSHSFHEGAEDISKVTLFWEF